MKTQKEINEYKKSALNFCKQAYSWAFEKAGLVKENVTVEMIREYLIDQDGDDEESYNAALSDEDIKNFLK